MALNANKIPTSGGKFKRPPALEAGTYPARLVQIIDLGVQPQQPWQGEEKPPKPEIYTTYELLDEFLLDEDGEEIKGKPRWISETLPMNSLDSDLAKSTKRYYALDPKNDHGGDWSRLSAAPAMLTLSAKANKQGKKDEDGNIIVYNNVSSVQAMREKDAKRAAGLVNEPKIFDMDDPDLEVFLSLPDWLRDKIKGALNYEGGALEAALGKIDEKEEVDKRRQKFKEQAENAKEVPEKGHDPKSDPEDDEGDDW